MSAASTENTNPKKRARTDLHGPAPEKPLRHHETYWFNDGNIVLAVWGVGFRVHRSVLSRVSEIFLSSIERCDSIANEMIDSCPVVHLHDAVGDVTNLMSTVYEGKKFLIDSSGAPFPLIASMIRLGHKYKIQDLRDYGLKTLEEHYPMSWKGWCGRPKRTWPRESAISVVLLARQTKELWMLPSALYECCQLDNEVILNGIRRPDDTLDKLSLEDIKICLHAKDWLISLNISTTSWLFGLKPSACCEFKESCRKLLVKFPQDAHVKKVFASSDLLANVGHVLESLVAGLCDGCQTMVEVKDDVVRRKFWLQLPTCMGVKVDGWET